MPEEPSRRLLEYSVAPAPLTTLVTRTVQEGQAAVISAEMADEMDDAALAVSFPDWESKAREGSPLRYSAAVTPAGEGVGEDVGVCEVEGDMPARWRSPVGPAWPTKTNAPSAEAATELSAPLPTAPPSEVRCTPESTLL